MKIIVLSDTHSQVLPVKMMDEMKTSDLIIHAGDFTDVAVLNNLKKIKDVRAVYGNMDGLDLRGILPKSQVFRCGAINIGLFHGEGAAQGLFNRVRDCFIGQDVQVVIFGHSHEPFNQRIEGVLYFNPGSPTDTIRSPYCSFGVIDIVGKTVRSQIVKIA